LLAGLVFLSWLAVIKSFALNLFGGKWLPTVRVFATILLIGVIPSISHWAWKHPESRAALLLAVHILLCVLIAAKIGVAMPIIRAIRRCHVATDGQLFAWAALWFVTVAILLGIALWLVPAARHSALALAAAVVLILPFNRMISMPLAWHHNRHR